MMLGGSAFLCSASQIQCLRSSIPGMDDILKQNPDLMNQFAKAAVGSIGKTENEYNPPPMRNMNVLENNLDNKHSKLLKEKKWVVQVV